MVHEEINSPIFEWLESVLREEDAKIGAGLSLVRDPPVEVHSYEDILHGEGLPPQPTVEIIDPSNLKVDIHLFLGLDLINSVFDITSPEDAKERAEELLRSLDKREEFRPEDHPKTHVALTLPEKDHLEAVRGRWTHYVWKRVAYDGSETPDFEGWVRDVSRIADALRGEGVKVKIYGGHSVRVLDEMGYDTVEVKLERTLVKLGYPRDPSVTWSSSPVLMNMSLEQRRGEEEVAARFFQKEGLRPTFRPRWWFDGRRLVRARAEGGNFILIKTEAGGSLFTGIGIRGSNMATLKLIKELMMLKGEKSELYGVPLAGYIRDWRTGAVHLDVVMMHAGPVVILNPGRMGFYSLIRVGDKMEVVEAGAVFKELGIEIDEMPAEGSEITLVNALNLGNGKLVVDSYNREANRYLEREWGLDVIEVTIPQLEAGGGGVRCATREYYPVS